MPRGNGTLGGFWTAGDLSAPILFEGRSPDLIELARSLPPLPFETRLSIEHAVSLGEYDFLQVTRMSQYSFDRVVTPSNDPAQTRPPDGLPEAIVNQIVKPDRFWMLLGHRFGDWNSRIQLHTFIAHESRHTERGCAVARSFDTDRLLFLDWLGITRATGEMRQLIEPLQEAARREFEESSAARRFYLRMRGLVGRVVRRIDRIGAPKGA